MARPSGYAIDDDWRRYHFILPPEVWRRFEAMAQAQCRSPHQQVAFAVREQLERWEAAARPAWPAGGGT